MCTDEQVLFYHEIEQPLNMIPFNTTNGVLWIESCKCLKDTKRPVNDDLRNEFNDVFDLLKMYTDDFNLTFLCYKENSYLLGECHECYDDAFGLNTELKIKFFRWQRELDKTLETIHDLTLKMNEILDKKM